jgi:hypothetical protein
MTMSTKEAELNNTNENLYKKITELYNTIDKLILENKMNKLKSDQIIEKLQKESKLNEIKTNQMEIDFKERIRGLEDTIDSLCGTIRELKLNMNNKN